MLRLLDEGGAVSVCAIRQPLPRGEASHLGRAVDERPTGYSRFLPAIPVRRTRTSFHPSSAADPSVRCPFVADKDQWLDVEAAARLLDFPPNTVYRLIREGKLPALRFPVRIRRQDLDSVLERCRVKPGELSGRPTARRQRGAC